MFDRQTSAKFCSQIGDKLVRPTIELNLVPRFPSVVSHTVFPLNGVHKGFW